MLTLLLIVWLQVEEMEEPLSCSPSDTKGASKDDDPGSEAEEDDDELDKPIATWTYCNSCKEVVTPLIFISENTWKFSFGKFLEVFFYNRDAIVNAPQYNCSCNVQRSTSLYFGCGKLAARFTYEPVHPYEVFVRPSLPIDARFHQEEANRRLELISKASSELFVKFDQHIEKVSREARSLFHSAVNRPEHLQTVLSELNSIGSEVDHAAKIVQEKLNSISDKFIRQDEPVSEALLRFAWFTRRYLFMLTNAWNEKLSITGQAITAMRRIAGSASHRHDGVMGPNVTAVVGDPYNEELTESMNRLRQFNEQYERYSISDLSQVLPTLPDSEEGADGEYDDDFDDPEGSIEFGDNVDADVLASRRRLKSSKSMSGESDKKVQRPTKSLGTRREGSDGPRPTSEGTINAPIKPSAGGAVKSAITRFFNRGGRESDPYVVNLGIFAEGRPRLTPGVNGVIVPVFDDQWSTIIAYSLSSTEYAKQFKYYSKFDASSQDSEGAISPSVLSRGHSDSGAQSPIGSKAGSVSLDGKKQVERQMLVRNKSHIKHTFRDFSEKGQVSCKFVCTTFWATQFHAVRQIFLAPNNGGPDSSETNQFSLDIEQSYIESLSSAYSWAASGGKSGASFARTSDDRFVIKCISRTELQMFLDCAPAYFEYLSKAFFHGL
jgi:1-phosphatidylinositol-3-phosphate 5-kinase